MSAPVPTNTYLERLAIDGEINLSDGHARQPLFPQEARAVVEFGRYYHAAAAGTQTEAELRFAEAFFGLAGEPVGMSSLLSYSASSLVAVVAGWLRQARAEVAMLEPGFDNIRDLLIRAGVPVRPISSTAVEEIAAGTAAGSALGGCDVLWLTLPNNPDGFELSRGELEAIARFCAQEGVMLVCDFCFRFFSEAMAGWSQYELLDHSGCRFLTFEDTGKTVPFLDLKIGLLRCSESMVAELTAMNEEVILNVSPWLALVLADVFDAYAAAGLEQVLWAPTRRRASIVGRWSAEVGFRDAGRENGAPPFKWLDIPAELGFDAPSLVRRVANEGVHLLPGDRFFFDRLEGRRFLRVPLNRPDQLLERGLEIVTGVLR